ncbi:hypothetical protein GCM10008905_16070 [Clostridium malenominatum]|uniref:Uncharacterized protein n=1 Tax=Clostridium malenominatum TaxID=1539 RepID=A0ABN1IXL2_9CLOT
MNDNKEIDKMEEFMSILSEDQFQIDLDIEDIIENALNIMESRKKRRENLLFIGISFCIIVLLYSIFFILGIRYMVYFQVFMLLIGPIIIIPISKSRITEGSNI